MHKINCTSQSHRHWCYRGSDRSQRHLCLPWLSATAALAAEESHICCLATATTCTMGSAILWRWPAVAVILRNWQTPGPSISIHDFYFFFGVGERPLRYFLHMTGMWEYVCLNARFLTYILPFFSWFYHIFSLSEAPHPPRRPHCTRTSASIIAGDFSSEQVPPKPAGGQLDYLLVHSWRAGKCMTARSIWVLITTTVCPLH